MVVEGTGWSRAAAVAFTVCLSLATGSVAVQAQVPGTRDGVVTRLVADAPVRVPGVQAREPMLLELADGTLFVTGFPRLPHTPPRAPSLWKSADGGRTWTEVDVGSPADGAVGNSDVDLAAGPDGTVYFVTMGFNRTTAEGTHISIGVSHDAGDTWKWTPLSSTRFDDRPWVNVAPDGTAHVIWNDGSGVHHVSSPDRGETWTELPDVHPLGGSSHMAIGPNGEIAVRVVPFSASGNRRDDAADLITVSLDGGRTWDRREAPGSRTWGESIGTGPVPRWVEPVAWDADGSLYHLWSEGTSVWLARSTDRGATWTRWQIGEPPGTAFYPYLVARSGGELAATWFSMSDSLRLHVAVITVPPGQAAVPVVVLADPIVPEAWMVQDSGVIGDTAGEYAAVSFLADGNVAVVTTLQDPRTDRFGFCWWRLRLQ